MTTIEQALSDPPGVEAGKPPTWDPPHAHGTACYWDVRECRWVCPTISRS
jgi:hypothetical protein